MLGSVRIRQYVYFSLLSDSVTASEITGALGVEPDAFSVRGSKKDSPPLPAAHSWRIGCDERGLTIGEQVDMVIGRLRPIAGPLRELVATTDVGAVLQLVRDFDADEGEQEVLEETVSPTGQLLTRLPGQHQLLGWHLDTEVLSFLVGIGAGIDCDEYGS